MGWRGDVRSINAANNRYIKRQEKMQTAQNSKDVVKHQLEYFKNITSIHKICDDVIDWQEIYNVIEPRKPNVVSHREDKARGRLENFHPNFIYKKLNLIEWRKRLLEKSIYRAIKRDKKEYDKLVSIYNSDYASWSLKHTEAENVVNKNFSKYLEIFDKYQTFNDEPVGKEVDFNINDKGVVEVGIVAIDADDIIPDKEYSVRASGTLSTKNMPASTKYDYYQDYICSSLIRVVRELFRVLPIDNVLANVVVRDNNPSTGHMDDMIIVSSYIDRKTFMELNFNYIDASEAIKNFKNNMSFKKTKGFEFVEKLIV